jgi:hypothetical protein
MGISFVKRELKGMLKCKGRKFGPTTQSPSHIPGYAIVIDSYRFVPIASISSIKTIAGAYSSATRKSSRTSFGPSP